MIREDRHLQVPYGHINPLRSTTRPTVTLKRGEAHPDRDRGSISERIYLSTASATVVRRGASGRVAATGRASIPQERWPDVACRASAGASLRAIGQAFGVSHETIRRTLSQLDRAARSTRSK